MHLEMLHDFGDNLAMCLLWFGTKYGALPMEYELFSLDPIVTNWMLSIISLYGNFSSSFLFHLLIISSQRFLGFAILLVTWQFSYPNLCNFFITRYVI